MQRPDVTEPSAIRALFASPLYWLGVVIIGAWAWIAAPQNGPLAATLALFGILLWAMSLIDLRYGILPNMLTYPLCILGLILPVLVMPVLWWQPLLGFGVTLGLFIGIYFIASVVAGRPAMGMGDIKLAAGLGAWCGVSGLPLIMFIAAFSAFPASLVYRQRTGVKGSPIPFGPFLALGGWLTLLYHDALWHGVIDAKATMIQPFTG